MIVNAKFRREILAGHVPALTDPEVKPGQLIEIEPGRVWITVDRRLKDLTWGYVIRDDRPNLLGKASGTTHISSRAIGASDSTQPGNLWTEPERSNKKAEDDYAREARLKEAGRRNVEDDGIAAAKRLGGQLRSAVGEVTRAGGDPLILIAVVKRGLEAEIARQLTEGERAAA